MSDTPFIEVPGRLIWHRDLPQQAKLCFFMPDGRIVEQLIELPSETTPQHGDWRIAAFSTGGPEMVLLQAYWNPTVDPEMRADAEEDDGKMRAPEWVNIAAGDPEYLGEVAETLNKVGFRLWEQ